MPNPENVKGHEFKKGQSGNPNGRPKGSLNSKTYLKKYLEAIITAKNPISGQNEKMPAMEAITIALIGQAMQGDTRAYNAIMDRFEGKVNQRIEMTGEEGGPVQVEAVSHNIDYDKLTDEELLAIVNAAKPQVDESKKAAPAKNPTTRKSSGNKKK